MPTVYEIIKGINQASANARDFPEDYSDTDNDDLDFLKREEGDKIVDSRVMDGFRTKVNGNILTIAYQSEIKMKEAHDNGFEDDIRRKLNDIKKFLQKEYKKVTDNSITFTEMDKDPNVKVQYLSRVRVWVEAQQHYKISGIDPVENNSEEAEENIKDIDMLIKEAKEKQ